MKLFALFLSVFSFLFAFAQPNGPWVKTPNTPNKLFSEYQQEFEDYWSTRTPERGQGYKQFKRWEYRWETKLGKDGRLPSQEMYNALYQKWLERNQSIPQAKSTANWVELGPNTFTLTDSWSAGLGRVNAIEVDPNNSNTIYIGAPAGGVWKTTDEGNTWTLLNDGPTLVGVSSIEVSPTNSNVVYISTGDDDANDSFSDGLFKSTDGGLTWQNTAISYSAVTNHIALDHTLTDRLFVATNAGLLRSDNGAQSFINVLQEEVIDVQIHPTNSNIVYACTESEFYRSSDGGISFFEISAGLPNNSERMFIAVTPADDSYVYVIVDDGNSNTPVYKSTNTGASFELMPGSELVDNGDQAWYDLAIAADDQDADVVYIGELDIWKFENNQWFQLNSWWAPTSASYTHADIHFLSSENGKVYCGSDGGVYISNDQGNNFTDKSAGLSISQFYKVDVSEQNVNAIIGGLQDNGGYYTKTGANGWQCYKGADGMDCEIDPNDDNHIYGMIQRGSMYESTDGGVSVSSIGSPETGAWVTPMEIDPDNSNGVYAGYNELYYFDGTNWLQKTTTVSESIRQIAIAPSNPDVIYMATTDGLFKTTNDGPNATVFTNLPDKRVTDIVIHNLDENIVWITMSGTGATEKVFKTIDGGQNWTDISFGLVGEAANCIAYKYGSNGDLYVGTDFGVYYYNELLNEFIPFSQGLSRVDIRDLEINQAANKLRAATYGRGVWETTIQLSTTNSNDLFLTDITNYEPTFCSANYTPEIKVKNVGTNSVTSFTVEYGIDNYNQSFNWTGVLSAYADVVLSLNSLALPSNSGNLLIRVVLPNGVNDADMQNNELAETISALSNGTTITVDVLTDCYGSETTWNITNFSTGDVVASGGPYANQAETILQDVCLAEGCYTFVINDSYGDGLTSSSCPNGAYSVIDDQGNNLVSMSTAAFGSQASHDFCIGVPIVPGLSVSKNSTCVNTPIDFTDNSFGTPISWNWVFTGGSPSVSSVQNPQNITYANAGTFDVTLTVTDANGNDSTKVFSNAVNIVASAINVSATISPTVNGVDGAIDLDLDYFSAPYIINWLPGNMNTEDLFNLTDGNYTLNITDAYGCEFQEMYAVGPFDLSTSASTLESGFSVYPNPTESLITLRLNSAHSSTIELYDFKGVLVLSIDANKSDVKLDLSDLSNGVYHISVKQNGFVRRAKILKQ
ncbi:MAG: T9SS type A sorting domain-containing protein [Lishizhenia sp.]